MVNSVYCCRLAALVVIPLVAICLLPVTSSEGLEEDYKEYQKRTAEEEGRSAEGGLAALLLKNLRFRDLSRRGSWNSEISDAQEKTGMLKRGVSVSELAQMFNNLKSRDTAGQMKLGSLRFGK